MSKKYSRRNQRARASFRMKLSLTAITLALVFSVGAGMLAQVSPKKGGQSAAPVSPMNFAPARPAKEYIHAGARLIATENDYSISPTYQSFAGNGATSASISVTAPSGANWSAVSNAFWITILSGASGSGNGTVTYSVAVNPDSMIRTGTITVNDRTFTVYQGKNFVDVPSNHIFYDWIGRLSARGVTAGCDATNYCPDQAVPHEQMATFVIRALGMPNPPAPTSQRFNDVPPSNIFYAFIEQAAVRGIWLGCGNDNYCPSTAVRRDEMAAIMIRARGEFNPPTPGSQRFNDVSPPNCTQPCSPNQYYNFIDRMLVLGITSGCSTNPPLYCPDQSVTRGQMAVFLVKAFNL